MQDSNAMDTNAGGNMAVTPIDSDLQKSFSSDAPGINPVMNWTVSNAAKRRKTFISLLKTYIKRIAIFNRLLKWLSSSATFLAVLTMLRILPSKKLMGRL